MGLLAAAHLAVYQIIVLLVLDFLGNSIPGLKVDNVHAVSLKNTLIFNAFVFCQLSVEI
ncbi:putative calcium-transporting ATPase [Rosa chinensis]|uniref:Putative calcium-transporting ATPase n=1 Tax=Rosa chinensis TaxID=74649 RepID=A0A2P6PP24_ROSCH|nr:putative calcium-transporting ATPase [Rosa chinensis]